MENRKVHIPLLALVASVIGTGAPSFNAKESSDGYERVYTNHVRYKSNTASAIAHDNQRRIRKRRAWARSNGRKVN